MIGLKWLNSTDVFYTQEVFCERYKLDPTVTNEGAIRSAILYPKNRASWDPDADISTLAAAYAFELIRASGFAQGNEYIPFVVAEAFLKLNGRRFTAAAPAIFDTYFKVANKSMSEDDLADWFRIHIK